MVVWYLQHNNKKGMYTQNLPSNHDEWKRCKYSVSDRCISPDILQTLNPGPNTSDTPKDAKSYSLKPFALELGKEITQVLALYDMLHTDTNNAWEIAMVRSSKTLLAWQLTSAQ